MGVPASCQVYQPGAQIAPHKSMTHRLPQNSFKRVSVSPTPLRGCQFKLPREPKLPRVKAPAWPSWQMMGEASPRCLQDRIHSAPGRVCDPLPCWAVQARVTAPCTSMTLITPMAFYGSAAEKPLVQPTPSAHSDFTTRNGAEP